MPAFVNVPAVSRDAHPGSEPLPVPATYVLPVTEYVPESSEPVTVIVELHFAPLVSVHTIGKDPIDPPVRLNEIARSDLVQTAKSDLEAAAEVELSLDFEHPAKSIMKTINKFFMYI